MRQHAAWLLAIAVAVSSCGHGSAGRRLIVHDFSTSAEGWQIGGDTGPAKPVFESTGGRSGGYISNVDEAVVLKDKDFTLGGRKVDLIVADTGGNPAGAKNKAGELVERDHVDVVLGPLAAFELLATVDYLAEHKVPTLAFAGAEDVTQRRAGPYLTRSSYTSAQCLYPLADYVRNEMKLKRAVTIGEPSAAGSRRRGLAGMATNSVL